MVDVSSPSIAASTDIGPLRELQHVESADEVTVETLAITETPIKPKRTYTRKTASA